MIRSLRGRLFVGLTAIIMLTGAIGGMFAYRWAFDEAIELQDSILIQLASLAQMLRSGLILFVDYGFPQREYYHPQRDHGTLMCHYRHQAHGDPFVYPGLQDITAHVDFTAVAEAGVAHGLRLAGYTTQAQFLINCGITERLARSPADSSAYLQLASQAQKLLSPAEMGELFKVLALTKAYDGPLLGFSRRDKSHTL